MIYLELFLVYLQIGAFAFGGGYADYIIKEIGKIMENVIDTAAADGTYDNMNCRAEARDKISRYVMRETGKRPMILPAIVEINTAD